MHNHLIFILPQPVILTEHNFPLCIILNVWYDKKAPSFQVPKSTYCHYITPPYNTFILSYTLLLQHHLILWYSIIHFNIIMTVNSPKSLFPLLMLLYHAALGQLSCIIIIYILSNPWLLKILLLTQLLYLAIPKYWSDTFLLYTLWLPHLFVFLIINFEW